MEKGGKNLIAIKFFNLIFLKFLDMHYKICQNLREK